MKSYAQWLESLITDVNYDTLIEESWSVVYLDEHGDAQVIGNSRVAMKKKKGLWVFSLDRARGEFPLIRETLEHAQKIIQVYKSGRSEYDVESIPQQNAHKKKDC